MRHVTYLMQSLPLPLPLPEGRAWICEDEEESKNRCVEVYRPLNSHVGKRVQIPPNSPPNQPCSAHCVPNGIPFASLVVHILAGEVASLFGQDLVAAPGEEEEWK